MEFVVGEPFSAPVSICRWRGIAVSREGRRHRATGGVCQDSSVCVVDGQFALVAIADGAGFSPRSQEGSKAVIEIVEPYLRSRTPWLNPDEVTHGLLAECRVELGRVALNIGCDVQDLATTLSFVAISSTHILAGRVGDGVIVAVRDEKPAVLSEPTESEGEFLNETVFVTSPAAEQHMWFDVFEAGEFSSVVLMSDGAAESLHRRGDGFVAPVVEKALRLFDGGCTLEVRNAIDERLMPMLVDRTQDDCSLALLRNVPMSLDEVRCQSASFQKRLLGVGNNRGLVNRLEVLRTLGMDVCEAAAVTGLSNRTIRRHRRALGGSVVA